MLLVPSSKPSRSAAQARGTAFTVIDGEPYVSIRDVDQLSPFLMNVVGNVIEIHIHLVFVGDLQ